MKWTLRRIFRRTLYIVFFPVAVIVGLLHAFVSYVDALLDWIYPNGI